MTTELRLCQIYHSRVMEVRFQQSSNICVAPVCTLESPKTEQKQKKMLQHVSAEMAVVMTGLHPKTSFFSPIILQHCISSRLVFFFFANKTFDFLFF